MNASDRLPTASLEEVVAVAALQTRYDRKYVVSEDVLERLLAALGRRLAVLEIGNRTESRYESVYFDTPDLTAYRQAAHGRRRRVKVRTRTYCDSGDCVLEVKARSGRDETVKHRTPYPKPDRWALNADGQAFVAAAAPHAEAAHLEAVLATTYRRMTFVDRAAGTRFTADTGLACQAAGRAPVTLGVGMVVETKSPGPATAADRWLWAAGHRPVALSKYCLALASLRPDLPANRWNRTLRRHFDWEPARP